MGTLSEAERVAGEEAHQRHSAAGAHTRRTRRGVGAWVVGGTSAAVLAACGAPGQGVGDQQAVPSARRAELRVHLVKREPVSDWIEKGLAQDVDGWPGKHPNIKVTLETHGTWTETYFPQVIATAAGGQLGDVVWYPPRHRSHISWGTKYGIVRDLLPLAKTARYDMAQFFKGAREHNTWEGKQYWLSYISEPVVPLVAYNKTKATALGLPAPKEDWTFDDLAEWAKRGTVADTFGYFRGEAGTNPFASGPYLRQWGTEPVDATGKKATFMDKREAFIQALTYRSNLTNVLKVSPNPRDGAIAQDKLFGAEQRVLALDIWPNRMQAYLRDFREFEMDFLLTPTVKRGDRRRSMLNEHVFGVTTASKSPEEAFSFLTWIAGKEMNVRGMLEGGKGPIARADVWADARITDRWPAYKKLRPLMDTIEADYVVANFRGEEFDAAYSGAYTKMERGEAPVLETATEIQRLTQAVLDRDPA